MRRALLFLLLVGCSTTTEEHDGGDAKLDVGIDTFVDIDSGKDCIVSGTVTDMNDVKWASPTAQVCTEGQCFAQPGDAEGKFAVTVKCGHHYHVIALAPPGDPRTSSAGIGIIEGSVDTDYVLPEPVRIPETPNKMPIGAGTQSVDVMPELTIEVVNIDFIGEKFLAGTSVPLAKGPKFTIPGKTILTMWALAPWPTWAKKGLTIAVKIKNTYGLAASETVSVYTVSDLTASLMDPPSIGTVVGGDITGATTDRITWLVLAK